MRISPWKNRIAYICGIALILAIVSVFAVSADTETSTGEMPDITGMRIGVQTGTTVEQVVRSCFDDIETVYFDSPADLLVALREHKIDALCENEPVLKYHASDGSNLRYYKAYKGRTFP